MGMINTKIGWKCLQNFFTDEKGQCGTYDNKVFQKTEDGATICVKYTGGGHSYIMLVSDVEDYTHATYNGAATNINTLSATIEDTEWNGTYYDDGSIINWSTTYPEVEGSIQVSSASAETVLREILTAAQVQKDDSLPTGNAVKDLVTVDFIKKLLIDVLKENNNRIFSSVNNSVVKYDISQDLNSSAKEQARTNIGAAASEDIPTAEQQAAWTAKQNALTFDSTPTQGSTNPVTSDGIYTAIQNSGGGGGGGSTDAVLYTAQSLTSAQQTQARTNIGAAASTDIPTDAVKYTAQTLTDAQKTQARTNIGAGTSNFSGDYRNLTNAPPLAINGGGAGGNIIGGTGIKENSTRYTNSVAYGALAAAVADHAIAFGNYAFAGSNHGGKHAVAIGYDARAERDYAVAIGNKVRAEKDYEWTIGKFNQSNPDTAFAYGDGTSENDRHNLMELKTDGTMLLNGKAVLVPEAVTGYDATKTQVLKNINGAFMWVDET